MNEMIGKIIGDRYEILEKIGEGGMSYVYKAKCNKLNRYVAIKVLKDSFKDNDEIVDRFKREATAIANLSNANIVNVLDVGTQNEDIHYIVMEYVKGKTLKTIINEQGKLPYDVAVNIAIKVANALECAHKNNIIHRDIKPHNILVTDEGVVKVTDFGIAKSTNSTTIQYTNSVMGSAHYFSPEQAKGSYIDCRTDLYSLGVVLYEMVTGKVPFDGDTPVTIALKHIQENPIPPKDINSKIPESLNQLILKAMNKEPIKRYQNAKELINDLQKIKDDPDTVIGSNKLKDDEDHTRIMAPVNVPPDEDDEEEDYDDDDDEDYEDDEDENKKSSSSKKNKILNKVIFALIAILVLALGGGAAYMFTKGSSEKVKEISVPDVVGKSKDEAKKIIESAELIFVEAGQKESDKEEGTVLEMFPEAGSKVKEKAEIRVIVSGGGEKLKVPNLQGMTVKDAKNMLATYGLQLGNVSEEFSSKTKGTIIKQSPESDSEVKKSDKIDVVVSKGQEIKTSNVPDLSGKTLNDAKTLLDSLKFQMKQVETVTSEGDKKDLNGKIYKQDPGAGYDLKQGSTITVYYYTYKEPEKKKYNANELVGKSYGEAQNWGKDKKISVNVQNAGDFAQNQGEMSSAKVTNVSPQEVEEGGSVVVTLEKPKAQPPKDEGTHPDPRSSNDKKS